MGDLVRANSALAILGSEEGPEFDNKGVTEAEFLLWKTIFEQRFSILKSIPGMTPWPPSLQAAVDKKAFLDGEGAYGKLRGYNPVNNPFSLLRPDGLRSLLQCQQANSWGNYSTSGRIDTEQESRYVGALGWYEEVVLIALASLNIADANDRRTLVKQGLNMVFEGEQACLGYRQYTNKNFRRETAEGWLTYIVLSLLDNPSRGITALGRARSLELLRLFPVTDLAKGFKGDCSYNSACGFQGNHIPRLPLQFCGPDERLAPRHDMQTIHKNRTLNSLIIKDSNRRIDWQKTATRIVADAPEAAVQILMLMMHHPELIEGALTILQNLPEVDEATRKKMFGPRASFRVEHRVAEGMDTAILVGMGLEEGYEEEVDLEQLSRADLIQLLRREREKTMLLEEEAGLLRCKLAEASWKNQDSDEELHYWRTGQAQQRAASATDRLDPQGYYQRLGLHPAIFSGLTDEQANELVKRQYRWFATFRHPDHPEKGGDNEKMRLINEAFEALETAAKRAAYHS